MGPEVIGTARGERRRRSLAGGHKGVLTSRGSIHSLAIWRRREVFLILPFHSSGSGHLELLFVLFPHTSSPFLNIIVVLGLYLANVTGLTVSMIGGQEGNLLPVGARLAESGGFFAFLTSYWSTGRLIRNIIN